MKTKTIILESLRHPDDDGKPQRYLVKQVTDSVEFCPGQVLARVIVHNLCSSKNWKVTIKPLTNTKL